MTAAARKTHPLATEILLLFLITLLVFAVVIGGFVFSSFSTASETQRLTSLADLAREKTSAIHVNLQARLEHAWDLAAARPVRQTLALFDEAYGAGADSPRYRTAVESASGFLREFQARWGYYDLFLIDLDGNVVFTTKHELDFATNLNRGPHRDSGLARVYRDSLAGLQVLNSAFEFFAPSGAPAAFIAAPVLDETGVLLGAVALQFDQSALDHIIQDLNGLGKTGEVVVGRRIGERVWITAPLRFDPDAAFKRSFPRRSEGALPVVLAAEGDSGQGSAVDWRGRAVLAAWEYLPDLQSGLVVKVDITESRALLNRTLYGLLWFSLMSLAVVLALGLFLARRISRPLAGLRKRVGRYASGDHGVRFDGGEVRQREVARLGSAFNDMAEHIRNVEQSREMLITELSDNNRLLDSRVADQTERVRAVVENALDGIITIDERGTIQTINPAVGKIFGYSDQQLLGQPVTMLMPEKYLQEHRDAMQQYVAQESREFQDRLMEVSGLRRDGETIAVELSLTSMIVAGQRLFLGMVRDVSERNKLRDQLEHSQRLESLGVLAGGIAHDFNNILASILGNASLAERRALVNPLDTVKYLTNIVASSEKAAELCKQMLAYSGHGNFVIKATDLSTLVEETARLLEVSIAKNVVLKYELTKNLPTVEADVAQLQQVIMNLVINASDAIGKKSGVISIATGIMQADHAYLKEISLDGLLPEGRYVHLEVSDTGCGMDEETRARMFEPFFTTKASGHGLGMSAVLGIVRAHHGALKVYSEQGHGTTFKMLLPATEATGEMADGLDANRSSEGDGPHVSGTVLVVDDEETIREMAVMMLEFLGLDALTAVDGVDGVAVYREHQSEIVAVLLDMTMPRMDGKTCFTELKRINKDVKVILSSGYNEQEAVSRFAGKGLAGFVQKPYRVEALQEALRKLL